jgi:hypothetical protein
MTDSHNEVHVMIFVRPEGVPDIPFIAHNNFNAQLAFSMIDNMQEMAS